MSIHSSDIHFNIICILFIMTNQERKREEIISISHETLDSHVPDKLA